MWKAGQLKECMCCGESEDFKAGKEEVFGTFATYKMWWDTVW